MSQKPCTIIRDAISIAPFAIESIDSPLIDIYDMKDIKCANPQVIYDEKSLNGARVIARNLNGNICGFTKKLGKGNLIHLGTWLGFDTEGHKPVYEAILNQSNAKLRHAHSGNYHINVRERFTNEGSALLFIGNYYNQEHRGKVNYTHPKNGETITIPYLKDEFLWPALYGILSPICLQISEKLSILHCSSDILDVNDRNGQLEIVLSGNRDLEGEIVFEGEDIQRFMCAAISCQEVEIIYPDKRVLINYKHHHQEQTVLNIILKK
jgi:hypothetical protein